MEDPRLVRSFRVVGYELDSVFLRQVRVRIDDIMRRVRFQEVGQIRHAKFVQRELQTVAGFDYN